MKLQKGPLGGEEAPLQPAQHLAEVARVQLEQPEALGLVGQAVPVLPLRLGDEGAEHLVPNDEDAPVVARTPLLGCPRDQNKVGGFEASYFQFGPFVASTWVLDGKARRQKCASRNGDEGSKEFDTAYKLQQL